MIPRWIVPLAPAAAVCGWLAASGCGASQVQLTALQQTELASYAQQQLDCVAASGTRNQAEACIAKVKTMWCGAGQPLQEQGACGAPAPDASTQIVAGSALGAVLDKLYGAQDGAAAVLHAVTGDAGGQ